MPSRVLESHVTLAQLANVEEVTVVAVVATGLAPLEEDAAAVEKVTKMIGHKLRVVVAVVAVEVTEAALIAEAVAVETDPGLIAPQR